MTQKRLSVAQKRIVSMHGFMRSNRSFDADTHRQGAARRKLSRASSDPLPVRTGQLQRYASLACALGNFQNDILV